MTNLKRKMFSKKTLRDYGDYCKECDRDDMLPLSIFAWKREQRDAEAYSQDADREMFGDESEFLPDNMGCK